MSEYAKTSAPKRFLFTTTGGYGHFHPLVPLAQTLKAAGHVVAFAAPPSLSRAVETAGLTFFPAGGGHSNDPEYQQIRPQLHALPLGVETEKLIYSKIFGGITPRLMVPGLVEVARSWKPDMFVRESAEYGAVIVADLLSLPHVEVNPLASLKGLLVFEQGVSASLDPIRQSWRLAPDPTLKSLHPKLLLSYAPPAFSRHGLSGSYPLNTHFVRPKFFDQSGTETLPTWVGDLPSQPTVYVTLGTEANSIAGMLQTIITGLRDLPVNLIVTVGRDKDPADFGVQPPNVHIERYIPQSLLLPYCDVMVMHGGSNSLLQAVEASLPLVIVPLIADQFFNAEIAQSLELGEVVELGQLTSENMQGAVQRALHNLVYRRNIGRLQQEMQALPDLNYAMELIEAVV